MSRRSVFSARGWGGNPARYQIIVLAVCSSKPGPEQHCERAPEKCDGQPSGLIVRRLHATPARQHSDSERMEYHFREREPNLYKRIAQTLVPRARCAVIASGASAKSRYWNSMLVRVRDVPHVWLCAACVNGQVSRKRQVLGSRRSFSL